LQHVIDAPTQERVAFFAAKEGAAGMGKEYRWYKVTNAPTSSAVSRAFGIELLWPMPPAQRKTGKVKRPFLHGTRERLTTAYGLGRTLVEEPRSFPGQLKLQFLKWARATWNARGGGFYACGFVVTFIFLEIRLLLTELFTSAGATDFILAQLLQILLRFTVDSLVNTVQALIWPAFVLGASPIWGTLGLAAGYLVFSRFAKERLTRLLFDDPGTPPMNADTDEK
jgi:hypothetical protein